MLTYFSLNLIISDGKRLAAGLKHCKEGWHLPCRGSTFRISPSQCGPVKDCLCFREDTMTVRAHSWPLCFIKQAVTHTQPDVTVNYAHRKTREGCLPGRGGLGEHAHRSPVPVSCSVTCNRQRAFAGTPQYVVWWVARADAGKHTQWRPERDATHLGALTSSLLCCVVVFWFSEDLLICRERKCKNTEQTAGPIKDTLAPASTESVELVEKFCLCCLWLQAHQVETWVKYLR